MFFDRRFEKMTRRGQQQPVAIAIISCLVAQLPRVLIVLPALLVLLGVATPRQSAG